MGEYRDKECNHYQEPEPPVAVSEKAVRERYVKKAERIRDEAAEKRVSERIVSVESGHTVHNFIRAKGREND